MAKVHNSSMVHHIKWVAILYVLFVSSMANAATFIPLNFGGQIGYTYGYTKSENVESNRSTLTVSLQASGFIWRPWFITVGGGLSFGLFKSVSSATDSGSTSNVYSGDIGFQVFPQSRFPFTLTAGRTDSRLESSNFAAVGASEYTNFRIALTQSYFARNGSFTLFTWNHNKFESEDNSFSSDNFNANYNMRKNNQILSVTGGYNTSNAEHSSSEPESLALTASHSYIPAGSTSVNSLLSHSINDPDSNVSSNESSISQASSVFTWRPEHKPYSFSGAALVNRTETQRSGLGDTSEIVGLSTQLGMTYHLTRSWRMFGNLSGAITDSGSSDRASRSAFNLNTSYSSEQYTILGFSYGWGVGAGFGASYTDIQAQSTDDQGNTIDNSSTDSQQSGSASFSHNASRAWVVGRASSLNLALSQSLSGSLNSENTDPNYALGHGISAGWSTRHLRGSTYGSASITDSRSYGDIDTEFQQAQLQLTHSRTISRVSAMNGSFSVGLTRQAQTIVADETTDSTSNFLRAVGSYRNSRMFGIYPLRFLFRVRYSASEIDQGGFDKSTVEGDAKFSYHIGLLSTAFAMNATYNLQGTAVYGANFQISRAF